MVYWFVKGQEVAWSPTEPSHGIYLSYKLCISFMS